MIAITIRRMSGPALCGVMLLLGACGQGGQGGAGVSMIEIDGSSTAYPITEAIAEEFQKDYRGRYRVIVGVSGTGGGFKKFCRGDIAIANASRPIRDSERALCAEKGIRYIELPVAMDALTVAVNPANDWVECLTPAELKTMWEPSAQGEINNWQQVRASLPDRELALYGPGTDSGSYDYFTEAIVGNEGASRGDFTASEDDNVLVQGVANDVNALGYFGLAYYEENRDKLKPVAIENSAGNCVLPSVETAKDGTYNPLSRPLFVYVRVGALNDNEGVRRFVAYYLDSERAPALTREVGYVPLPVQAYALARQNVANRETGTAFADGAQVGISIEDLLRAERTD